MDFSEENIDDAIAITKKAGLEYLYNYGKTFESWGHFQLNKKKFPEGYKSMKKLVEKAQKENIKLGTHVLSNFITTNDPYVTPVPDKRLAKVGSSKIVEEIDSEQTEIVIESPDFFNQMKNNNLKTVMIDNELIRYGKVSQKAPWTLLDCQRGAFNTVAANHKAKSKISKLLDHPYKVFLTNAELTIEVAKNIAKLYNETGLRQISFDGLEGNRSTGLGAYGESLMPYTWYNALSPDMQKDLIIDASRTTHFFWHLYSRMNWGEPWRGDFRESQTEYRLKNQAYFKRNFMPGMLGWFKMTSETSVEDIEWLLARAAGFDAGFAFVTSFTVLKQNGNSDEILKLINEWEKLRLAGSFTDKQKELLKEKAIIARFAIDMRYFGLRYKSFVFMVKKEKEELFMNLIKYVPYVTRMLKIYDYYRVNPVFIYLVTVFIPNNADTLLTRWISSFLRYQVVEDFYSLEFQSMGHCLNLEMFDTKDWIFDVDKAGLYSFYFLKEYKEIIPTSRNLRIYNYASVVQNMLKKHDPPFKRFPCVTPSWDNSPRRKADAVIIHGSTPQLYESWLNGVIWKSVQKNNDNNKLEIVCKGCKYK